MAAIVDIKEPEKQDIFLFHLNADKFLLLDISTKEAFLSYKLEQIAKKIKESTDIEMKYFFITKGHEVEKNFEEGIGYLL